MMPAPEAGGVSSVSAHQEGIVQYIVSSRGRPIGTTDLDFVRIDGSSRSGWFHPNELGEEVLPAVAMVLPAMRAFVCRDVRDADGRPIVQPNFRRSSLFADLAEAFHRVDALDLTLHHADGTLIPTSQIGIQDTEQLLELSRWDDLYPAPDPPMAEDEWEDDPDHLDDFDDLDDAELPSGGWQDSSDGELDASDEGWWVPDEDPRDLPRYQIHLMLVDPAAIP
jgi:hypothetical protein